MDVKAHFKSDTYQCTVNQKMHSVLFGMASNHNKYKYLYAKCMMMLLFNYVKILFLPVKCNLVSKRTTLPRCAQ